LLLLAVMCVHCTFNSHLQLLPLTYHLSKAIGLVYESDVAARCNMRCDRPCNYCTVAQFVIFSCFKMYI
jgi:hypothetical protein